MEFREQFLQPLLPCRAIQIERLENPEDVLLDRQAAEDRRLLRQISDTLPRATDSRSGRLRRSQNYPVGARTPTVCRTSGLPAPFGPAADISPRTSMSRPAHLGHVRS